MALPKFYKVVTDQQGNIVPQVLGSVYNKGTAVLASLYQDDAGVTPLANPMTSDATYGSFKFYLNPGHYDLTFTKPGYTFEPIYDMQVPQDVLTLGTMATQNANAVAISGGSATGLSSVGIANSTPSYPLDVTGSARLGAAVGIGGAVPGASSTNLAIAGGRTMWQAGSQVGINISPNYSLQVQGNVGLQTYSRSIGMNALTIVPDADSGAGSAVVFVNAALAQVGSITTTGSGTAYNTSSDVRLKHAITPLTGALDVIRALNPITHLWKSDGSRGYSFLAHEVQETIPDGGVVTGEPDAVDDEGRIVPQMYDPSKLVPWLTAALQEAMAQVEALTARVAQLEGAA